MAQSGSLIVTKNKPTKMVLVGFDPDAQTLSFAIVGQPAHGRIVGTAPNFMYQPAKNFTGIDAVTFVVSDGQMQSDAGVMTITVTGSTKSAKPAKPGKTTKTKKCTNGKKVCK
jgi:Bacterial Ig domain